MGRSTPTPVERMRAAVVNVSAGHANSKSSAVAGVSPAPVRRVVSSRAWPTAADRPALSQPRASGPSFPDASAFA